MELTTETMPALVSMIEELITDFIGDDVEEEELDEEEEDDADEDEDGGLIDNPFCVEFYPDGETPEYAYFQTKITVNNFVKYCLQCQSWTLFCKGILIDEQQKNV